MDPIDPVAVATQVPVVQAGAMAVVGVYISDLLEALRLYVTPGPQSTRYQWPVDLPLARFFAATLIRSAIAAMIVVALAGLDMLCNLSLAFIAGIATVKVSEVFFGYLPGATSPPPSVSGTA